MSGHGFTFPPWLDRRHPEALRGKAHLRSIDPQLVVGLDTRRGVFQVWGLSKAFGGVVPICDCQDDEGRPFRGIVPWEIIAAALVRAREGELSCDRAARHNEQRERDEDEALSRRIEEGADYYAQAVAVDRYPIEDIDQGWRAAAFGEKAPAKGKRVFAPGGD